MKKQVYKLGLVAFLGLSAMTFAQVQDGVVGINTEAPSATLDVVTKTGADKSLRVVNTSAVETVTVLNNGKIGINEVAPSERLEVGGNVKAKEGALMSSRSTNAGGNVLLENPLKSGSDLARRWRIWNMTGGYTNSLQFWSYDESLVGTSRMMLTDNGNVAIGVEDNYVPTEKLEVVGSIKSTALAGAGTRNVVVDEHGKLVAGDAVSGGGNQQNVGAVYQKVRVFKGSTFTASNIQDDDYLIAFTDAEGFAMPAVTEKYKNRTLCIRNATTAPFGTGAKQVIMTNVVAGQQTINAGFTRCYTSFEDTDGQWKWISTSL